MPYSTSAFRHSFVCRAVSVVLTFVFSFGVVFPPYIAEAQVLPMLPLPGAMVTPTPGYMPALIKGITVHPENPLEFDFIVDTGDSGITGQALETESVRLIKYFLASLTVPEKEMWVNLSPHEKDRVIPESFGVTGMGMDLLAQDYILKQLTASLMYPEEELGQKFWDRVYEKAAQEYGTTDIPLDSFHKVWIVPDEAVVYQKETSAFVLRSHLKVMMEEDYLALRRARPQDAPLTGVPGTSRPTELQTEVMREVILPEIEKEVNEGKNFANLRQIYQGMILAAWFKKTLKESLLGQVYVDKNKLKGVEAEDQAAKEKIYAQYLKAFEKGVYNYIKEDYDPATQQIIPRNYFSGGFWGDGVSDKQRTVTDQTPGVHRTYKNDFALLADPAGKFRSDSDILKVTVSLIEETGTGGNAKQVEEISLQLASRRAEAPPAVEAVSQAVVQYTLPVVLEIREPLGADARNFLNAVLREVMETTPVVIGKLQRTDAQGIVVSPTTEEDAKREVVSRLRHVLSAYGLKDQQMVDTLELIEIQLTRTAPDLNEPPGTDNFIFTLALKDTATEAQKDDAKWTQIAKTVIQNLSQKDSQDSAMLTVNVPEDSVLHQALVDVEQWLQAYPLKEDPSDMTFLSAGSVEQSAEMVVRDKLVDALSRQGVDAFSATIAAARFFRVDLTEQTGKVYGAKDTFGAIQFTAEISINEQAVQDARALDASADGVLEQISVSIMAAVETAEKQPSTDQAMLTEISLKPIEKTRPVKFGTSGDRGKIGKDFNENHVLRLSEGTSQWFAQERKGKVLLIGYDPRKGNTEFSRMTAEVAAAHGIRVRYIAEAPTPTPVLALLANNDPEVGAVVNFTASHNPKGDNGFKVSDAHGGASDKSVTDRLTELSNQAKTADRMSFDEAVRRNLIEVMTQEEALNQYVYKYVIPTMKEIGAWSDIVNYVKANPDLKVIADAMNGTGGPYLRAVYQQIAEAAGREDFFKILHEQADSEFSQVNGEPNTMKEKSRKDAQAEVDALNGNGFASLVDGDMDRFGNIDSNSEAMSANDMLALLTFFLNHEIGLTGAVGKTVATTNFVNAVAEHLGLEVDEEPVGFKYFVKNVTDGRDYLAAGEESFHVGIGPFMKSWDDGLVIGLMSLWIKARTGMSLVEYRDHIRKAINKKFKIQLVDIGLDDQVAYQRIKDLVAANAAEVEAGVPLSNRTIVKQVEAAQDRKVVDMITKDGIKMVFEDGSWMLLRPSGTQILTKLYIEAAGEYSTPDQELTDRFETLKAVGERIANGGDAAMLTQKVKLDTETLETAGQFRKVGFGEDPEGFGYIAFDGDGNRPAPRYGKYLQNNMDNKIVPFIQRQYGKNYQEFEGDAIIAVDGVGGQSTCVIQMDGVNKYPNRRLVVLDSLGTSYKALEEEWVAALRTNPDTKLMWDVGSKSGRTDETMANFQGTLRTMIRVRARVKYGDEKGRTLAESIIGKLWNKENRIPLAEHTMETLNLTAQEKEILQVVFRTAIFATGTWDAQKKSGSLLDRMIKKGFLGELYDNPQDGIIAMEMLPNLGGRFQGIGPQSLAINAALGYDIYAMVEAGREEAQRQRSDGHYITQQLAEQIVSADFSHMVIGIPDSRFKRLAEALGQTVPESLGKGRKYGMPLGMKTYAYGRDRINKALSFNKEAKFYFIIDVKGEQPIEIDPEIEENNLVYRFVMDGVNEQEFARIIQFVEDLTARVGMINVARVLKHFQEQVGVAPLLDLKDPEVIRRIMQGVDEQTAALLPATEDLHNVFNDVTPFRQPGVEMAKGLVKGGAGVKMFNAEGKMENGLPVRDPEQRERYYRAMTGFVAQGPVFATKAFGLRNDSGEYLRGNAADSYLQRKADAVFAEELSETQKQFLALKEHAHSQGKSLNVVIYEDRNSMTETIKEDLEAMGVDRVDFGPAEQHKSRQFDVEGKNQAVEVIVQSVKTMEAVDWAEEDLVADGTVPVYLDGLKPSEAGAVYARVYGEEVFQGDNVQTETATLYVSDLTKAGDIEVFLDFFEDVYAAEGSTDFDQAMLTGRETIAAASEMVGMVNSLDGVSYKDLMDGTLARNVERDQYISVTTNPPLIKAYVNGMLASEEGRQKLMEMVDLANTEVSRETLINDLMTAVVVDLAGKVIGILKEKVPNRDVYFSVELDPRNSRDFNKSVDEARKWASLIDRKNLMTKVLATPEATQEGGIIETLLKEGINVNVTGIMYPEQYERVVEAYKRAGTGGPSFASFFVSRWVTPAAELVVRLVKEGKINSEWDLVEAVKKYAELPNAVTQLAYHDTFLPNFDETLPEGYNAATDFSGLDHSGVQYFLVAFNSNKIEKYLSTIQKGLESLGDGKAELSEAFAGAVEDIKKHFDADIHFMPLQGPHVLPTTPQKTIDAIAKGTKDKKALGMLPRATILEGVEWARALVAEVESLGMDVSVEGQKLYDAGEKAFIKDYEDTRVALGEIVDQVRVDSAMLGAKEDDVGGIDLNPEFLDLKIKRDGNGIPLPMLQQPMELLKEIEGFLPVIINITPVQNLPMLLGLDTTADDEDDPTQVSFNAGIGPYDYKARFEQIV